jgi:nitrite reductase/ring-hydroxylating ferredoxin subunit
MGEEVLIPDAEVGKLLKRKPSLGIVGRHYQVECPTHGKVWRFTTGHHVTSVPKGRKKRKKR